MNCQCGHHESDHRARVGDCQIPECECKSFRIPEPPTTKKERKKDATIPIESTGKSGVFGRVGPKDEGQSKDVGGGDAGSEGAPGTRQTEKEEEW